ncbi:hypothetical protein FB566_2787 [Stackebrandtia endophytica]|uniref:Uncharacterized protein n=1 Tax=Stackebrandtia endophytica TaxID=1496996 RepID=A0A543AXD2_9ACTN|nr:hypothetical protein FB566_2787 [Stackebrandtia endophytica]
MPYLSSGLLVLFGVTTASSSPYGILVAPLAVNEMVLAGRLLIRGFRVGAGDGAPRQSSSQVASSAETSRAASSGTR